ncbi:MAG: amidohydrolase family protein [Chloroflexota bacterium]
MGGTAALRRAHPGAAFADLHGDVVMPGMICAHTHLYSAFARGMSIPGDPPASFEEILRRLWWRLDKLLTLKAVQASAQVMLCDAIRSGCTTVVDHHASPSDVDGSLDVIAEAVSQAGIRACLAYEVSDRDGPEAARAGMAENERFIKLCRQAGNPCLAAAFGLHAAFTLSDATLEESAARAAGAGFHLHLAEDPVDAGAVERLARFGILGPSTLAAHCVHLNAEERAVLADSGTRIVHNVRSNMNNAVGLPPETAGAGLGSDGFSMNMLQEMKVACLAPKLLSADPRSMPADRVVAMAFGNNARIAAALFEPFARPGLPVGEIVPGAAADLVVLDYRPPTPLTAANLPWHLVFGIDGTHVKSTMAGGRWLMKERRLLTLDEREIAANGRDQAAKLWKRVMKS